jgi:predicted PurR-regulated permease PerM
MPARKHSDVINGTQFLIIAAAIVVIIYGINQAQSVVSLFLVSVFLTLLGTPAVLWLERKRIHTLLAVMIVMTCMIVLLLMVGGVVGASLSSFSDSLPTYQKRLQDQAFAFRGTLAAKGFVITDKVLLDYLNPGAVMSLTAGLISDLGSVLSNIILILLTVTFILLEASSFPIKLRSVLGEPHRVFPQVTVFVNDIKRYMIMKTIISLIAGVTITVWLMILGVDYPVLWGFIAFLLHFIPNLGMIIAAIPAMLLAWIQFGLGTSLLAGAGYFVVGFTLGNVVEPRLMGRKLGLSTLVVFLSLIFWGELLGPIGVVLCIPFTMTLKFAFQSNESTRWIAVLLGSEKSTEIIHPMFQKKIHSDA